MYNTYSAAIKTQHINLYTTASVQPKQNRRKWTKKETGQCKFNAKKLLLNEAAVVAAVIRTC